MNKTKKKIILAAIQLFNKQGISNVSNQQIADESKITLSNFNYHFGTKKDLVLMVMSYIGELLEEEVYGKNSSLTQSGQGYAMAKSYFEFGQRFSFFFLETYYLLLTYPELKGKLQAQISAALQLIKNVNYIAIGKGYLHPIPAVEPELYDHLAKQIWANNHFHFTQNNITDEKGDFVEQGLKAIYYLYYPYLTQSGKDQFANYLKKTKQTRS